MRDRYDFSNGVRGKYANRQLFRVTLPHACFGVYVLNGRIVETAPIFHWALYKNWQEAQDWIKRKGGCVEVVP